MDKFQFKVLVSLSVVLIALVLAMVLPPVGWVVLGVVALSYGLCWVVERAIRRVWRR